MPHRVVLAAFPARIRRRHGAELITTLAEMTGGRPSRADRLRLIADGLRKRFRLPTWRPLGVLTVAAAVVVGGAIGLAAGSLTGEQMYPSMPAVAPLASQMLGPQEQPDRLYRDRFHLAIGKDLATEDIGTDDSTALQQQVQRIHDRLTSAGWEAVAVQREPGLAPQDFPRRDQWEFSAQSHGLRATVSTYTVFSRTDARSSIQIMGYPIRPATYLPLVFGGLLVGLLAGWLVGVAMAHRLTASRYRVPAVVVGTIGVAILAIPAARLYQGCRSSCTRTTTQASTHWCTTRSPGCPGRFVTRPRSRTPSCPGCGHS